jgi:thioredoxin reductase (NADPH)
MKEYRTKVLIIGSGPAGYTAAIYAARANLEPIVVQGMQPGGQLMLTTLVENYPGFVPAIDGPKLMEQMQQQSQHVGAHIVYDTIAAVDFSKRPFVCKGDLGNMFIADTVIIATGAQAKWLNLESEAKFRGFGVSSCATCDGFFFKNKIVAVVGGGNTAAEEALYLTRHASQVYLIHRRDKLRADKVMQERVFQNPKIEMVWNHVVEEIRGRDDPREVTSVLLRHTETQGVQELAVDGLFIAIGHTPATAVFQGQLQLDAEGYICCPPGSTRTSVAGVFAAGDVQDKVYRQAITAAGQGCMAALDAEHFLATQV